MIKANRANTVIKLLRFDEFINANVGSSQYLDHDSDVTVKDATTKALKRIESPSGQVIIQY